MALNIPIRYHAFFFHHLHNIQVMPFLIDSLGIGAVVYQIMGS